MNTNEIVGVLCGNYIINVRLIKPTNTDMKTEQPSLENFEIKGSAQLLRFLFSRLIAILRIHSEGYFIMLSEQVDETYIKLRRSIENIIQSHGFEELQPDYPQDTIPQSLHSLEQDADIYWESSQDTLNTFTGRITEFCISIGADNAEMDEAIKEVLTSYDEYINSFKNEKKKMEKNWLQKIEKEGGKYQERMKYTEKQDTYINTNRLNELRSIQNSSYDLTKLIQLCEELNKDFANESYMAVAMLVRAILDHLPPIFSCKNFSEIANNYSGGSKSFKQSMENLEKSSRKIADAHLHTQIRKKEVLPNKTQVNFSQDMDVLLAEIIRLLK